MTFLEDNEIGEWCTTRGVPVDQIFRPLVGAGSVVQRAVYSHSRTGEGRGLAEDFIRELGAWSECLLLPLEWGIWSSSEDWPAYYLARGAEDEKRSLETAPGHLFATGERAKLVNFLAMMMQNGWDAWVLPAQGTRLNPRRLFISHDEWIELREAESAVVG